MVSPQRWSHSNSFAEKQKEEEEEEGVSQLSLTHL